LAESIGDDFDSYSYWRQPHNIGILAISAPAMLMLLNAVLLGSLLAFEICETQ